LDGDEKSKVETALKDAEEALKSDNKDTIDAKTQALTEASHKLTEKMYAQEQAQQTQTGAESPPTNSGGGENPVEGEVVDAEFEEVKDKK
ncbi:MAG: molecular chaperone DnaK, partial [Nitrosomonadaceae bacterium]